MPPLTEFSFQEPADTGAAVGKIPFSGIFMFNYIKFFMFFYDLVLSPICIDFRQ